VFDADFPGQLRALGAAASLRSVVITRLTPERLPVLAAVLEAARKEGLQLLLSNPALQLLNERAGADEALASALRGVRVEAINRGSELQLGGGGKPLRFVPIPTPRWPDLVAVYSEDGEGAGGGEGPRGACCGAGRRRWAGPVSGGRSKVTIGILGGGGGSEEATSAPWPPPASSPDNILFSSNFFSAHTAEAGAGNASDDAGWSAFAGDWANYYDCMLAPVARQAATALDRLNINAMRSPAGGALSQALAPLRRLAALVHELTLGADDGVAEPLAVAAIAPMHGPVVRRCLTELVGR
jgi:flavorubredoxin